MVKLYSNISVVVQGPVEKYNDREQEDGITFKCLQSIRQHLPGATIILSTWRKQNLDGLDYDLLVLSEDPGRNIRQYNSKGRPKYYNNNRQIVSSVEGLKQVKTKYAMKLRSDNYLTSSDFVILQKKYQKRCDEYKFLQERIVMSNVFARKFAKGHLVPFHLNDFFYFGLTSDLLLMWDLKTVADFKRTENKPFSNSYPNHVIDCAQLFWLLALQKFDHSLQLSHLLDVKNNNLKKSDICYANNIVIASPDEIGLGLPLRFIEKSRVSTIKGKCSHIFYFEWQGLYKKYCDPSYIVESSLIERIQLFLARLLHVYPRYIEEEFRALRKRLDCFFK